MRVIVAPAGSRGDFQPLLALSIALQRARHEVVMVAAPNFAREADAFGVPAKGLGLDTEAYVRGGGFVGGPARGSLKLMELGRELVAESIEQMLPLAERADLIIGAGAQIVGPTVAEKLGARYLYVGYTPQVLRSRHHSPITTPFVGLPQVANRLLWWAFEWAVRLSFGPPLNRKRRELGLEPVRDFLEHIMPARRSVVAADPELAAVSPDLALAHPLLGSLHLSDERPLPAALETFLSSGEPPVYVGFGSMPDGRPEATVHLVIEAVRRAGRRLLLSAGWAGFGGVTEGATLLADDVMAIGPTSHALLFPRVAAVVHHGGAGTTSAALRSGRPQLVVPHLFDQFQWARWVEGAGVGPSPIPRGRLSSSRLGAALAELLGQPRFAQRAEELGHRVRARDPAAQFVAFLERFLDPARA